MAEINTIYTPSKTVREFIISQKQIKIINGPVGCTDASTEFLTPIGWKRIDQYIEGDQVAQWAPESGQAEFVQPEQYIKEPCDEFWHFKNTYSLDMMLSDEHRVVYLPKGGAPRTEILAKDLAVRHNSLSEGFSGQIMTSFAAPDREGIDLNNDELRIMVAVIADGHFNKTKHQKKTRCVIQVRRERKKKRLRSLFEAAGISYMERCCSSRPTEVIFTFYAPWRTKVFDERFYAATKQQLELIAVEVPHWDGHVDKWGSVKFDSVVKENADFVQYVYSALGQRASLSTAYQTKENWNTIYTVRTVSRTSLTSLRQAPEAKRVSSKDGFKYCFSVPSTYLILRRNDRIFVTGNSGKSVGCLMSIVRQCQLQEPEPDGIRRSRWAIIRNTNQQLKDTTLKSWLQWFPDGAAGRWKVSEGTFYLKIGDVEAEILFRPLDTAQDLSRLLSLELTSAYFNELREIDQTIFEGVRTRIGRYPKKDEHGNGGATNKQIIADTNPPDMDSWVHDMMEDPDPKFKAKLEVFKQPGGMEPDAENLKFLPTDYYEDMMVGASQDFIDVHVHAKYGKSNFGKPVHQRFNDIKHVSRGILRPEPTTLVVIGMDFGLTPAAVFKQMDAWGRINTFDAVWTEDDYLENFLKFQVMPLIRKKYPTNPIVVVGDPSGNRRGDAKGESCFDVLKEQKLLAMGAVTNDPDIRIQATDHFLMQLAGDAEVAYAVDPANCAYLVKALRGGYRFPKKRDGDFMPTPQKNMYSHVAEANQYGDMFYQHGMEAKYARKAARKKTNSHTPRYRPHDSTVGY